MFAQPPAGSIPQFAAPVVGQPFPAPVAQPDNPRPDRGKQFLIGALLIVPIWVLQYVIAIVLQFVPGGRIITLLTFVVAHVITPVALGIPRRTRWYGYGLLAATVIAAILLGLVLGALIVRGPYVSR